MSDSKYGRLFTEEDVHEIVEEAIINKAEGRADTQVIIDKHDGKFPKDEPLFLLRGKDKLAAATINFYIRQPEAIAVSDEFVDQVLAAKDGFDEYAATHRDLMKDPD